MIAKRNRGFSLVEILVGMAIGLLGIIVVMQVFAVAEGRRRATSSGADAQSNGAAALFSVARDLRMAGYGIMNDTQLSCRNVYAYYDGGSGGGPIDGIGMAPVAIVDGGAGSDSLTLRFATSPNGAVATVLRQTMPQPSSELDVNTTYGCRQNDLVIVSQGDQCTLMQLTAVQDQALKLQHNPGSTPSYNPPAAYQNANAWPAYTSGAVVSCIGRFTSRTYAVNGASLQLREFPASTFTPVAGGIVNVQAQYGISVSGSDDRVMQWVDATGAWADPTPSDIRRIKAVRLALVARSQKKERDDVSPPCTNSGGTLNNGPCAWPDEPNSPAPTIDLSADPDWRKYRYKVFETIIPLRNAIWSTS